MFRDIRSARKYKWRFRLVKASLDSQTMCLVDVVFCVPLQRKTKDLPILTVRGHVSADNCLEIWTSLKPIRITKPRSLIHLEATFCKTAGLLQVF